MVFPERVRRIWWGGLGVAVCILVLALPMFSQTATFRLSGNVMDEAFINEIPGATVTVTDIARGLTRTLTTDDRGRFEAADLLPGNYSVRVTSSCFPVWENSNIVLGAEYHPNLDIGVPLQLPLPTAPPPESQAWGTAVNGLQIALRLDETTPPQCRVPKFILTFRNIGKQDVEFYLGEYTGPVSRPYAVVLTLTDAQNKSRRLEFPVLAMLGGNLPVPEIELLHPGSTDSIRLDLTRYNEVLPSGRFLWKSEPGAYSLTAQFDGIDPPRASPVEGPLPPFVQPRPSWKGTIISNQVSFEIPNQ